MSAEFSPRNQMKPKHASDEDILRALPIYDHLGMTEDQLATICRELWDCDPVIARHRDRITEREQAIVEFQRREDEHDAEVSRIENEENKLKAELRRLDTLKREVRGAAAGMRYHVKRSKDDIRVAESSIVKRKRQLYYNEAQKRLRALGKQLKLGRGGRAQNGHGSAVITHENPQTP